MAHGQPMNERDALEFCSEWLSAWTGNQPDKLIDFYAKDAFYRDPANREGLKGHREILPYFGRLLEKNPEWKWEATEVFPTKQGFIIKWKAEIQRFLAARLKLRLNAKRQSFQPVTNVMNFLVYIVRRDYILARRRVVNNLKSRLLDFERKLIIKDHSHYVKIIYDYQLLERLRSTLASYFGHFKWANSHRLN